VLDILLAVGHDTLLIAQQGVATFPEKSDEHAADDARVLELTELRGSVLERITKLRHAVRACLCHAVRGQHLLVLAEVGQFHDGHVLGHLSGNQKVRGLGATGLRSACALLQIGDHGILLGCGEFDGTPPRCW